MSVGLLSAIKNVPIREWAPILCLFACFFWAKPCTLRADTGYEDMEKLYGRYKDMSVSELYRQGHAFLDSARFDEAMVCFTIAGNRYSPKMSADEKRLCAYSFNNAGGICQIRCSYSTAFSYYKKAMQMADEPIHQTYNNIAGIYLFYNDYQNAKKYLSMAFNVSLEQKNWESVSNALQNIIFLNWCLDSLGASARQIELYRHADSIPHDARYQFILNVADGTMAAAAGHYRRAIDIFERGAAPPDSLVGFGEDSFNAPLYIAKSYMALGDYAMALRYLKDIEDETRASGAMYMLMLVYELQVECQNKLGNTQAARDAKYEDMNLKDSINTAEELGKINNIEFNHEVDKYEKRVVELNHEKDSRTLVAVVSIAALLLVAVFLVIAVTQNRRLWESNKVLYRKNDELLRQTDTERQLRSTYTRKLNAYLGEIAELKETMATLTPTAEAMPSSAKTADFIDTPDAELPPADDGGKGVREGSLTEHQRSELLERIYQQMDDVDFISQPDLTVERLAQAIGVHDRYVSQIINESMDKNFNTLLNEYRIREVCKRLTDTAHYGQMTNETIAEGLGYKSRSHFIRTFKKITGLTPSQYQRMARESKNSHES